MPLSQGDDLSWYSEFTPDDYTVGHFRGDLESLNISNAQPGFHYYYARNNPNDIVRFINAGWAPVGPDDPESYGTKRIAGWNIQAPIGSERAFQDVILMKIPLERYNEQRRQAEEIRKEQLNGVTQNFIERGDERARQLHRPPNTRSLYYAGSQHGQYIEER